MKNAFNIAIWDRIGVSIGAMILATLALSLSLNTLFIYFFALFVVLRILVLKQSPVNNRMVYLFIAFFLIHFLHLFVDENSMVAQFEVEKKLSFVFLPILCINSLSKSEENVIEFFKVFAFSLNLIGLSILILAIYKYSEVLDTSVFFYHNLVEVFNGNAIYYSLLFMLSLVVLLELTLTKVSLLSILAIIVNILMIYLLSSKTYFFTMLLVLFYYLIIQKKVKAIISILILVSGLVLMLTSNNSILERYSDISVQDLKELKEDVTPSTEFNGLSLRLTFWDIGLGLVSEDVNNLILGVGPGDAQQELDSQISLSNMYTGDGSKTNTGYLGYNFHSQYIQTLVETGLIGLISLMLMFSYLIMVAFKQKNRLLGIFSFIFLIGFITESYLSRQVGVVSFVVANSMLLMPYSKEMKGTFERISKRTFDVFFSLMVVVFILSWLVPLLGIFIFIETKSTPFFVQKRVGQNNMPFYCIKFRTMRSNKQADNVPAQVNDNRITKLGYYLRKYGIDELPQFINVLKGEMSVVGPRPLMVSEEVKFGTLVNGFSSRLVSKPGITGLAQAYGYKGLVHNSHDIRIRYRLDQLYTKQKCMKVDLRIMLKTIVYLLKQ